MKMGIIEFKQQMDQCMSGIFSQLAITQINRDHNKKLVRILHTLLQLPQSVAFRKPVPHKALKLEDYKNIIKKPVDLNLIRRQYNQNKYKTVQQVLDDIQLCWENCKLYNSSDSEIYTQAQYLQKQFLQMVKESFPEYPYPQIETLLLEREEQRKNRVIYEQRPKVEQNSAQKQEPVRLEQKKGQQQQDRKAKRPISQQSKLNDIMEPQESQHQASNHEQQPSELEGPQHPPSDPIVVNLQDRPSREQILAVSRATKEAEKGLVEQVLEILYTHEKDLLEVESTGDMRFSMNDIHLSTYMRICKVLKIEGGQTLIE